MRRCEFKGFELCFEGDVIGRRYHTHQTSHTCLEYETRSFASITSSKRPRQKLSLPNPGNRAWARSLRSSCGPSTTT